MDRSFCQKRDNALTLSFLKITPWNYISTNSLTSIKLNTWWSTTSSTISLLPPKGVIPFRLAHFDSSFHSGMTVFESTLPWNEKWIVVTRSTKNIPVQVVSLQNRRRRLHLCSYRMLPFLKTYIRVHRPTTTHLLEWSVLRSAPMESRTEWKLLCKFKKKLRRSTEK